VNKERGTIMQQIIEVEEKPFTSPLNICPEARADLWSKESLPPAIVAWRNWFLKLYKFGLWYEMIHCRVPSTCTVCKAVSSVSYLSWNGDCKYFCELHAWNVHKQPFGGLMPPIYAFLFTHEYIYLMCSTQVHSWSSSFAFRSVKRASSGVPSRDFNSGQLRTCLTRHPPTFSYAAACLSYAAPRPSQAVSTPELRRTISWVTRP